MARRSSGLSLAACLVLSVGALSLMLAAASFLDADLTLVERYYDGASDDPWPQADRAWARWSDRLGQLPAAAVVLVALAVALRRWRARRAGVRSALGLALFVVLGPGLMVHGLKAGWGRERPRDVLHWQRPAQYREWWQPQGPEGGASFPSGHAAAAASMIVVAGYSLRRRPRWAAAAGLAATAYAAGVSLARVVDGAHFLTDVIAGWWVCFALAALLLPWAGQEPDPGRQS